MHDELTGNSDSLDRKSLSIYAQEIGLDVASFDKCVDSGNQTAAIRAEQNEATKLGIFGTPTFFLGVANPDGKTTKSVQRFDGLVPYARLKDAIDRLLDEQKVENVTNTKPREESPALN